MRFKASPINWVGSLVLAGLSLAGFSSNALAQGAVEVPGDLIYGPLDTAAVPTGGTLMLIALGVLLLGVAYGAMRYNPRSNRLIAAGLLALAGIGAALLGPDLVGTAQANSLKSLDNPAGGSVTVPSGCETYQNSSGVALRIISITGPTCSGNAPVSRTEPTPRLLCGPLCEPGTTILANGDQCATYYNNPCAPG